MKEIMKHKVLETKKNLVLQEISKIFEEEGFSSVKMQDIANKLSMSVGALYKLFSSKEELYYEYIAYQINLFYDLLVQKNTNISDAKESLEIYTKLKFEMFKAKRKAIEDPVIADPLFFFKMNTKQNNPAKPIFEYLANLFELFDKKEPLKEKNYMKLAYLFNAYTMGYIEYWVNFDEDLEDASLAIQNFLEGFKLT
ncbi:TetR/AcrR family transcriptional regulator [Sulfurospirillum sp. 1307]